MLAKWHQYSVIGQGRIGRNDVPALDRAPRHYDTMRP